MAAKVASALDMTLDDVIKIRGNKRAGGRGPKKGGGSGDQAGGRKAAAEGKPKEVVKEAAKAAAEKSGEKADVKSGGGRGVRRLRRVTAAQALAPAAKAAAAAAKATATAATAAVSGADQAAARAAKTPTNTEASKAKSGEAAKAQEPAKPIAAPKGTDEKLGMSLDDLAKFEVRRRKSKVAPGEKTAAGAAGEGSGRKRGGRRRVMKLRTPAKGKAKAKAKAKGKAKAKAQSRRKGMQESWGSGGAPDRDFWMGGWSGGQGQGQESWRRGNDFVTWESRKRPSGGGMYADWSAGAKRKASEDWGPPEKWMRSADGPRGGMGWGRSSDDSFGWGGGSRSWGGGGEALALSGGGGAYRPSERWGGNAGWTRALARTWTSGSDWGSAPKGTARRVGAASEFSTASRNSNERSCRIRVSNVPKNLDWRDIKEAFEDNGRVIRCEVERGVAWITFQNPTDAKKAVQTFDRGELNGQTIFVTHE